MFSQDIIKRINQLLISMLLLRSPIQWARKTYSIWHVNHGACVAHSPFFARWRSRARISADPLLFIQISWNFHRFFAVLSAVKYLEPPPKSETGFWITTGS